jgi:hypothetical protein
LLQHPTSVYLVERLNDDVLCARISSLGEASTEIEAISLSRTHGLSIAASWTDGHGGSLVKAQAIPTQGRHDESN